MDDCPRCQQSEQYGCGCTTLEISKWRADEIERLRTELTDEIEGGVTVNIDDRIFCRWTDQELQAERFKLQKEASEASAKIGAIKAELMHRALESKEGRT
tara:strand:- start:929 stop:1228 length:300 start_codon:yes stop_codon:yes gene_type:complete